MNSRRPVNSDVGRLIDITKMRLMQLALLLFAVAITLAASSHAQAQIQDQKIFEVIPTGRRASFVGRLNLYIQYSLADELAKLETLYSEGELCSLCKGKRECVDNCRPPMTAEVPEGYTSVLIALRPRKVQRYTAASYWNYSIDADREERVSWKGKPSHIVKSKVRLFAVYEHGDWFFSLMSSGGLIQL